jgi:cell division protease FtsH
MAVLMGGRASESLTFKHLSTGAADDIARATDIARNIVTRYGMTESLGNVAYENEGRSFLTPDPYSNVSQQRNYSEVTAREIDCAIRKLVGLAYDRALEILKLNHELLNTSALLLLEKETLEQVDLEDLFKDKLQIPKTVTSLNL